jgi:DNA-binding transcriptional LysR family regulator
LPAALAALQKTAPDFQIELRHDLSRRIQHEVQRGRLDLGIVINPVPVPDIVLSKLSSDQVAVWTKSGAKPDLLIYNPELIQSQSILKRWKTRPARTIETDNFDLTCRLAAKGLGYGIIPNKAVELSGEKLARVESLPTFQDEIVLVHRPEFGKTKAEKLLLQSIRAVFVRSAH